MRRSPCRRFTILDGMILIAATAVGVAALRAGLPGFLIGYVTIWTGWHWQRVALWLLEPLTYLVLPWTAAWLGCVWQ